jgi:hypothetical protein
MDGGSAENAEAIFCPFILNIKKNPYREDMGFCEAVK